MKRLAAGDERVVGIVQKRKLSADGPLRLSVFVVTLEAGDRMLLGNTLTRQVYALTPAEWALARAGDLSCPQVRELAEFRFLVEPDYDETAQYSRILAIMRTMEPKRTGVSHYTILPTTGCNARCVYCYEEGWPVKTMTPETADAVSEFICRTRQMKEIELRWLGGEPLCAPAIISRICRTLRDRGVEFHSTTTTNGSLLTPELLQEALDLWRLRSIQVSMDGAREDYDVRKRYVRPDLHNYDRAMDAVAMLADAGLDVVIRCNYDEENLARVRDFLEDCRKRFPNPERISFYTDQLCQASTADLFWAAEPMDDYAASLGFRYARKLGRHLPTCVCMADSEGREVVIDPLGGLHACDNRAFEAPLGTVFDAELPAWPKRVTVVAEECRYCPYLPVCTPFPKRGCPMESVGCQARIGLRTKNTLKALLKKDREAEEAENEPDTICP